MEKVKGMTLEEWITDQTKPREISLWGEVCQKDFVPEICSTKHGDGRQLIYFGTVNQRPRWWLMLIDSKEDVEDSDFDIEGIVIEALEEEFGSAGQYISEEEFNTLLQEGDEECIICENYENWLENNYYYPKLQIDGYHWGLVVNMETGNHE